MTNALNALKGVIRYEFEGTSHEFQEAKYLHVPQETFLEECYVPVGNEREIIDACFHTNELTCIIGPRGCGKTTTLSKILKKDCPEKFEYIAIDFSKEPDLLRHLRKEDPLTFENELRKRINRLLQNKFYDRENTEYLSKLCKELLKRPPDYEYRNVYEDYIEERQDASIVYEAEENISYDDWVQNGQNPTLRKLIEKVRKRLGIKQLIWGLLKFDRCKMFMVVFDNVDRIPNFFQPYYLSVANDIQNDIGIFSKCIVAIREENVRRPKENTDCQADFIELAYMKQNVSIPMTDKRAVDMPTVKDNFTNTIILKRLNLLKGKVNDDALELIKKLTRKIRETYFQQKLSRIVNGSVRLALDVYYDFLEYILQKNEDEILAALESPLSSRIFESYFYSWLTQRGGKSNMYLYNLVDLYYRWEDNKKLGCFPEHLILTYLYNKKKRIEKTGQKYYYTTVKELQDEMLAIGFDSETVRKAIFDLYYMAPVSGQMIDMRNLGRSSEITISSIDDNDQVWILPRGEICCSDTTHKYTYFVENIYRYHYPHKKANLIEISDVHIEEDVKFLSKIAYMHLEGLSKIRNNMYTKYGNEWLRKYKEKFCIGGHLQLDRIIYNHYKYLRKFRKVKELRVFGKLKRAFRKEVENINFQGVFDSNACNAIFEKESG